MRSRRLGLRWTCLNVEGTSRCIWEIHIGWECLEKQLAPGEVVQGIQNGSRHTLSSAFVASPGFYHHALTSGESWLVSLLTPAFSLAISES